MKHDKPRSNPQKNRHLLKACKLDTYRLSVFSATCQVVAISLFSFPNSFFTICSKSICKDNPRARAVLLKACASGASRRNVCIFHRLLAFGSFVLHILILGFILKTAP